jgi:hypothetical protein
MNSKNLTVCKSNSVIEASFRLSLNEQRAILFCISQANSINALLETDEFELSAKDFSTVYGVSKDVAYNELHRHQILLILSHLFLGCYASSANQVITVFQSIH